jgi:GTP-binding protein
MFIDEARIMVKAGQGGSGCVSFRREKFVPKGGPDGGDGGSGGSIIIIANKNLHTLLDFRYHRKYQAGRGQHGLGANKQGKSAADLVIKVPVGTVVRDADSKEILTDLLHHGDYFCVAKGGRGGRGNAAFATSTNQTPREWEVGQPGEQRILDLELKLLADIGLVGFPNAGKSTLLSRISAAHPKIANYPFTTLEPNLGIVSYKNYKHLVVADIPGLIKGSHQGKGLGHKFLRHIERTRALAYMIEITDEKPENTFKVLFNELREFSPMLVKKPYVILLSKTDIQDGSSALKNFKPIHTVIPFSSVTGENLQLVLDAFYELVFKVGAEKTV